MAIQLNSPLYDDPETEEQLLEEAAKLDLEDFDSLKPEQLEALIKESLSDFDDTDLIQDEISEAAARIARGCITEKTRTLHTWIIKHFIVFHQRRDASWDAKGVTKQTPNDICDFITQKCGPKQEGYEGKRFSTAVSTRAALTYWYRTVRPNESVSEWRVDRETGICYGLPTRSRAVSEFMVGLEKMKAKSGKVLQSAHALSLDDMHRLYDLCTAPSTSIYERRWGLVRYTEYLLAWLMVLRSEEVLKLNFQSIDMIPGEREYFEVQLSTRKTAQTGVLHGLKLHANDSDPKICPVRAVIMLALLYGGDIKLSGPLFLKIHKTGAVLEKEPVTQSILSRALTTDMQKLGYKTWALYGTHSFRRGGCQHRIKNCHWTVDMIAAWGGWSQVEAATMFRYFYSPVDNHEYMGDYDRNNPKRVRD